MKNKIDLGVHSNLTFKRLIKMLNLTVFIILISFSNVLSFSSNSDVFSKTTEYELQQIGVTGTVTDASTGEAMPGVNILIKGTTVGAISDVNGKFSIASANQNSILVFSFIGYVVQEVSVAGKTIITVNLAAETTALQEVVVIGYGTQRKETLTGSVANIKAAEIMTTKSTSVASSIQGKIVGVQIRQQTNEPGVFNSMISVRGFGAPLLVIDGVVRDGMSDFERLNPNDIESMSVLKDAAAAIYGMNAANGVLIVTTKKGVAGKTEFSFSSLFTSKQPTTAGLQKIGDAYTLRSRYNEMLINSKLPPSTSESELEKYRIGTEPGYTDYNWYEETLRDWVNTQQYNFSIRGGNEFIKFFTSFGSMNDHGYFKDDGLQYYKKHNFRTNIEAKLTKGLTANISFAGRSEHQIQPPGGFFWLFKRILIADRAVGPYTLKNPNHLSVVPAEGNPWTGIVKDICGYDENKTLQSQTTIEFNYETPFLKGLSLGVLGAYDVQNGNRALLNKAFQLYDYKTDVPASLGLSSFRNTTTNNIRKNFQAKISYQTSIAQAHNINATFVNDIRQINYYELSGRRQYDNLYTKDIINQGSLTNQSTSGYRTEEAYVSYLGRFNYDFKSKYLFEFSFREDGSYRYSPENRWAFFPAFSLGWRIGQEAFIKNNLPSITDFKIRGSWGQSGVDAGNAFEYFEGYKFGPVSGGYVFNDGVLTLGMVPPGVVNRNLTWVNTTTIDFGTDIELWKGKLGFTGDYFERLEEGLLATRITTVPNTFGASFPQENLNSRKIKGFELALSHRNTIGKVTYGVNANLTYSRLYRLHVEESAYTSSWNKWTSTTIGDGRFTNYVFGYERDGIYTNITQYQENAPLSGGATGNSLMLPGMDNIVDINGDGQISSTDQRPILWAGAGTNPPIQFGANMYIYFRNFDINLGLQGASLFTIVKSRGDQWGYGTRYPCYWLKYEDRWKTQNSTDNPYDPATTWIPGKWEALTATTTGNTTNLTTDKWRMDATYLRIKNLEIGYNIPVNITKKIMINSCRAFVNCFNLFTFCQENLRDVDPEREEGDYQVDNRYPIMRSFNFGVEIKF